MPLNQPNNHSRRIREIAMIGAILLLVMLVRLYYLDEYLRKLPDAVHPLNDARMYWEMGRTIYQQGWSLPGEGPYYQAPVYPYALAILHQWGIHRIEAVLRFQAFVGILSVLLTYMLARRIVSPKGAAVAALLFGLCHYPLFFESKLLATTLGTFLFLLFAFIYALWIQHRQIAWLAIGAVLFSISILCRANLIFALPFLVLHAAGPWKTTRSSKMEISRGLARAMIFLSLCILGILPVTLRNYVVGGSWVPISANSGVTLYMGTNDQAQGGLGPVEGLSNDIDQQKQGSIDLASKQAGRELSPSEASSFWVHKTAAWIIKHPFRFLVLETKKILWALYAAPPAVNYSAHFEEQWIPLFQALGGVSALTLFLGLSSIPFLLFQRTRLESFFLALFAGYILLSLVFYASDRFLAAMLPFLAIQGVCGWKRIGQWIGRNASIGWQKKRTVLLLSMAWILLAGWLTFNPFLGWNAQREIGMGWYNAGVFYSEKNRLDDALQAYEKAQKSISDFPPLFLNLGVLYAERGDLQTSTHLFQRVLELDPTNQQALKNLQINQGRLNP